MLPTGTENENACTGTKNFLALFSVSITNTKEVFLVLVGTNRAKDVSRELNF